MNGLRTASLAILWLAACGGSDTGGGGYPDLAVGGNDTGGDAASADLTVGGKDIGDSGSRDLTVAGNPPDLAASPDLAKSGNNIKTVFVILMENNNWSGIKGSASAPYINNTLLPMASHAEQYFNPPGIHPSEPNYLWLEAGTNFGIFNDADPGANHQKSPAHLTTQLKNANVSWRTYQENITGTKCPLVSAYPYGAKHNPFIYFDDSTGTNNVNDAYCIQHNRPFTELAADLKNNSTARYNFITPNLCNDMHDNCKPLNDGIKQGDTWLSMVVPQIMASQAYADGGAIFVTWDESEGGDFPIGMIVVSPLAKGKGYMNQVAYTHGSTLRTMQEIFAVQPLLGDAANQKSLSDLFTAFP